MQNSASQPRRGRPRKQPASDEDTRAALIRSGTELLTEQGFFASGLDAILRRVGVPKGSFYYYFASKDAFGRAVLEHYGAYFARKLDRHLLNDARPPLERIQDFVEDAAAGMQRHDYRRGCLVGNLGQEVSLLPEDYRSLLTAILESWQKKLAACLEAAKVKGDLAEGADTRLLAEAFWIGWEGAVMRARLEASPRPLTTFLTAYLQGLPR
ncbi:TetR/AcrR family transcriptional regulator [Marinospirillum perlucidum]|uniref:acrylate utilization transcriptional regulator AcuR n=1 Tax=Marinospirillum perlucidum TaxID=1982602 RepID=UPI000DF40656|nr:TetR/AcrR family transcriptional regulator [Marinospirillum perlucidum]